MQFIDYYDNRDKDLRGWYVVCVRSPYNAQLFSEHVQWLTDRASSGRFFLQPMSGAFWFENRDDAFLYCLQFGGHPPHRHEKGIKKGWHRQEA